MGYTGAGGKLIDEKNQKRKISWHCPFNLFLVLDEGNLLWTYYDICLIIKKSFTVDEKCSERVLYWVVQI